MRKDLIIGLAGVALLFIAGFLPIAEFNNQAATIFPLFDNYELAFGAWSWKDISAFAVSFFVLTLVFTWFLVKEVKLGKSITSILLMIISSLIFLGVFIAYTKMANNPDITMSFGYAWLIIIIGGFLTVFSGFVKKA